MNDNWIEIVETLQPYVKCNSKELKYQQKIENCLKFLGWRSSNKTMQSQLTLGFGAGNTGSSRRYFQRLLEHIRAFYHVYSR